jgi:DNA-binding transcriptional LysR family regulator
MAFMKTHPAIDWDKLKAFYAAAQAGSFTNAGKALGCSQSAVSRQVQALERDLSVVLFSRYARGLALTRQGHSLCRAVARIHKILDRALRKAKANKPTGGEGQYGK